MIATVLSSATAASPGAVSGAQSFLAVAAQIGTVLVVFAIALSFVRLARGPSLPDRVVALDVMTILIVAFCGLHVLSTGVTAFLDVALVLAVIGFLATVALARFAERRQARSDAPLRDLGASRPAPEAATSEAGETTS